MGANFIVGEFEEEARMNTVVVLDWIWWYQYKIMILKSI